MKTRTGLRFFYLYCFVFFVYFVVKFSVGLPAKYAKGRESVLPRITRMDVNQETLSPSDLTSKNTEERTAKYTKGTKKEKGRSTLLAVRREE